MSPLIARWQSLEPQLRALLRIVLAILFMMAGTMKLFAFPMGMPPDNSTAHFLTEIWFAGMLETFGGLMILIGLCTRPVAFVLSGEMAVAYFQGHAPMGFWPIVNHGELAIIYCFLFLWFSSAGPGAWSVDNSRKRRNTNP